MENYDLKKIYFLIKTFFFLNFQICILMYESILYKYVTNIRRINVFNFLDILPLTVYV